MESHKIEIVYFTDPWCTWCWGSEPILRKIREEYGDQVKIKYVMGGLVESIDNFYDPVNKISTVEQVAPHWLEASRRHGMPVDEKIFFEDPPGSTYPANIAYHAAKIQSTEVAEVFLRRMREAASSERKNLERKEVLVQLAKETGLDAERFSEDLKGKAEEAFKADLAYSRSLGVTGFPTFLVRNKKDEEVWLNGYQPFENFVRAFEKLSKGEMIRTKPKSILNFINKYRHMATVEVAEVFELSLEQAQRELVKLEKSSKVKKIKLGNGYFWEPVK